MSIIVRPFSSGGEMSSVPSIVALCYFHFCSLLCQQETVAGHCSTHLTMNHPSIPSKDIACRIIAGNQSINQSINNLCNYR